MENRKFSIDQKITSLERQEYMCGYCGQDLWRHDLSICEAHHIVPYSMQGASTSENLIVLCPNCHTLHDNLAICGVFYGGYEHPDIDDSQIRNRQGFESTKEFCKINSRNEKILNHIMDYEEENVGGRVMKRHGTLYSKEFTTDNDIKTNDKRQNKPYKRFK